MSIEAWVRRHRARAEDDGLNGPREADPAAFPPAWLRGTRSFYDDLHEDIGHRACAGTACWHARGCSAPKEDGVHCLGRCYEAPAAEGQEPGPIPRASMVDQPVVLRHLMPDELRDPFEDYALPSGEHILEAVIASGLRGRGGAAYPTGAKWRAARDTPAPERFVVCNGDEGDPGSYVDRLLLEESPHAVLAGMRACATAIGARRGIVFIRGEYPRAAVRVERAIEEARGRGLLGDLDIRVVRGAGSYVAGEETALLAAIEGLRAEPRPKPPYPAQRGLLGLPTVVQNVETLSVVPWVVRHGRRADTKVLSLSGAVAWRGAVEIALGTPLSKVLDFAGGPAKGTAWKMALIGGPMGCVLPASRFDQPLSYELLPRLGHGGIVLLDQRVRASDLARHLYAFAASESCGNCAPCRIGTTQLKLGLDRASLERVLSVLETGSLCGFGLGVPGPLRDLLAAFPEEMPA